MQGSNRNEQLERERDMPEKEQGNKTRTGTARRVASIVAIVLLVIAAGTLSAILLLKNTNFSGMPGSTTGQVAPGNAALALNANGVASFIDQPGGAGYSNGITISINGLQSPPSGYQYDAWLVDTTTKQNLALGQLTLKDQAYGLDYAGNGANLVGLGDEIEITLEQGTVTAPTGKVLLSATFPPQAFVYVRHMLYSFSNTPGKIGLLVGLIEQAKLLNSVTHVLTTNPNAAATQCIAQSALDIIEGKSGSNYKALSANCAALGITSTGDGYGLLGANGYIANAQAQDLLANSQPDATSNIHEHSRHVTYGLQDMNTWLTTAEQDALALLNNPANSAKAQDLATMANRAYYGYDANHDGKIDYVPGEAGSMIAYQHGQYMTAMVLAPNS
ncbi:MAG TPA: hypothetical protein VKR83_18985 [Ktedonobacteraceae bacterium]|nr:hypothetical protein [Ktedonobacteraceae bacterium]